MGDGYVSGSGAALGGYAVVPEDQTMANINLAMHLDAIKKKEQDDIDQKKKEDAAHAFALQKYYGTQLDPSQFATGTPYDAAINEQLSNTRKDLSNAITKKMSDQDIDNLVNQGTQKVHRYYNTAKAITNNVQNTVDGLKDEKGIDLDAVRKAALAHAFYNPVGENGQRTLRGVDDLDYNANHVEEVMREHPELFLKDKNGVNLDPSIKGLNKTILEGTSDHYEGANRKTFKFKGDYAPSIEDVTVDKNGFKHVIPRVEQVPVYGQTDANGKPVMMNIAPKETKANLITTRTQQMQLDNETNQYLKSQGISLNPNSPYYDQIQRKILLDKYMPYTQNRVNYDQQQHIPANQFKTTNIINTGQQAAANVPHPFNTFKDGLTVPISSFTPGTSLRGGTVTYKNGTWVDETGQPYDGNLEIPRGEVPMAADAAVRNLNKDDGITGDHITYTTDKDGKKQAERTTQGNVPVEIKNGQVVRMQTNNGQWADQYTVGAGQTMGLNKYLPMKGKIIPGSNFHAVPRQSTQTHTPTLAERMKAAKNTK